MRATYMALCLLAQGNMCGICGHPFLPHDRPVLDHIMPVARGGEHSLLNVQAAHDRCDHAKGLLTMDELTIAVQRGHIHLPEPPSEEPQSAMEDEYGLQ